MLCAGCLLNSAVFKNGSSGISHLAPNACANAATERRLNFRDGCVTASTAAVGQETTVGIQQHDPTFVWLASSVIHPAQPLD
jgi:hypothetical protein